MTSRTRTILNALILQLIKERGMNLFNCERVEAENSDHWVMIDPGVAASNPKPLRRLNQKLRTALDDLGRIEYQLNNALTRLRCDLTMETHDNLHGRISEEVSPGIRHAIASLADELDRARRLTSEIVSDDSPSGGPAASEQR